MRAREALNELERVNACLEAKKMNLADEKFAAEKDGGPQSQLRKVEEDFQNVREQLAAARREGWNFDQKGKALEKRLEENGKNARMMTRPSYLIPIHKMDYWTSEEFIKKHPWDAVHSRNGGNGYYGPVLRNISVKSDYRVALETCLGMALYNMVVRDDDVASEILKAVKQYQLGRVECTPLNRLPASGQVKRRNYPKHERAIPLVDCVECDSWMWPVVAQMCGNWMVCNDLEVSAEIAKSGEFDCVTLDGDKELKSGIISGGKKNLNSLKKYY